MSLRQFTTFQPHDDDERVELRTTFIKRATTRLERRESRAALRNLKGAKLS